ncbi:flavin-containing monooxygenase [Aquirhabdus parva]|uniref:NAD(P)/FAD-dependent oxidoreductase n=1 Tax=Aquirhabdus parva TaxID=2283318 RepID=A0A345PAM1_9GAMM|nr:NAD(P)/FAD-dependent oxidoreductase [Aquirhabdus parva]AXI04330.1 NAD(P)/FAD-dependent oxidoreductase [Aquirhabdus parva]
MSKAPQKSAPASPKTPEYQAIIVGTGFGGMGAAIQLNRLGITSILMLDEASDVGGTWHHNSYPGIAVDIPSVTYSYSFEPNPYWSRIYAPGRELKAYAHHVAQKYNLRQYMRFNALVEKSVYDEEGQFWTVSIQGQAPVTARILILATGFLSHPKMPDIKGIENFAGKVIHTARWDHTYDLNSKRAAVIGTGATSVQLVPEIAPKLAQLDVYQRTAIWVSPKNDSKIAKSIQKLFASLPESQKIARFASSSVLELMMVTGVLHNKQLSFLNKSIEFMCRAHMRRVIKDPVLREKLTPHYDFGCKRPTFSNTFYPTFNRKNVELVTTSIDHIEADGIVTQDGVKRKIDTLILATGFKVWEKGNFPAFDVIGKSGIELGAWWDDNGFQSYEGLSVPNFPNLFNLHSPYAYSGFSYFSVVDYQMAHIERCLGEMIRLDATSFEVNAAANSTFTDRMKHKLDSSIFTNGNCASANSYYFNPQGEATLLRPTTTYNAMHASHTFPLSDYQFA